MNVFFHLSNCVFSFQIIVLVVLSGKDFVELWLNYFVQVFLS